MSNRLFCQLKYQQYKALEKEKPEVKQEKKKNDVEKGNSTHLLKSTRNSSNK